MLSHIPSNSQFRLSSAGNRGSGVKCLGRSFSDPFDLGIEKVSPMAQRTPELTSWPVSGDISSAMEDSGPPSASKLQDGTDPNPRPSVPPNFVWCLPVRRSLVQGTKENMAVDIPVLRPYFDPWNRDQDDDDTEDSSNNSSVSGDNGRCQGCKKISEARARAAAQAQKQPPRTNGSRGECVPFYVFPITCNPPPPFPRNNPHATRATCRSDQAEPGTASHPPVSLPRSLRQMLPVTNASN